MSNEADLLKTLAKKRKESCRQDDGEARGSVSSLDQGSWPRRDGEGPWAKQRPDGLH